jgi:hypothetical protein
MRRLKKFAQVDLNGSEGLYETTADRFSRQAKHHLSQQEKINASMLLGLEIGDMVIYEGREAEVRIAQGPRATVGIIHEGNLKMVHESKVTRKVEEGVLGGVQAMPAINRMMQLAGLESGPVVVEENQTIMEDMGTDMLSKMIAQAEQLPAYKGNAEAARFYVIGALLSAIGSNVNANPPQTVVGQSKKQELTPLATIGADLIKSSQDMTKGK